MIEKSESIAALVAALSKAQSQMHSAKKTSDNPFFKSKYADLATVWDACKMELTANGLSIIQLPAAEGNAVSVTTLLAHNSGEFISGTITMQSKDSSPQAIGSAITYARRYGLAAIISLPQEDDDGNASSTAMQQVSNALPARPKGVADAIGKSRTPKGYDPGIQKHRDALEKALIEKGIEPSKHLAISDAMSGKSMTELEKVLEGLNG
jgi:hypothetical protein